MKIEVTLEELDVRTIVTVQSLSYDSNTRMQSNPEAREILRAAVRGAVRAWLQDLEQPPAPKAEGRDFGVAPV